MYAAVETHSNLVFEIFLVFGLIPAYTLIDKHHNARGPFMRESFLFLLCIGFQEQQEIISIKVIPSSIFPLSIFNLNQLLRS